MGFQVLASVLRTLPDYTNDKNEVYSNLSLPLITFIGCGTMDAEIKSIKPSMGMTRLYFLKYKKLSLDKQVYIKLKIMKFQIVLKNKGTFFHEK